MKTTDTYDVLQQAIDARRDQLRRACDVMSAGASPEEALALAHARKRRLAELDEAWAEMRRLLWAEADRVASARKQPADLS